MELEKVISLTLYLYNDNVIISLALYIYIVNVIILITIYEYNDNVINDNDILGGM